MKKFAILFLLLAFAVPLLPSPHIFFNTGTSDSSLPEATKSQSAAPLARMSREISIRTAGQGKPWVNLSDGRSLVTSYTGADRAARALENNQAKGLSLASADFDEDGLPDLVCGFRASDNTGILSLHRGNLDAVYPFSPKAQERRARGEFTEAPFLSPALVFELPAAAEFLAAGDFDADSHQDIAAASSGDEALYLLRGDGHGSFGAPERIALSGRITAMTVGEINRSDGLADLVIGVAAADGAKALVFEGPSGALKGEAEEFPLSSEADALTLGQFDDEYEYDLAIASGSELVIVHGRDRKLSEDSESRAEVKAAKVTRQEMGTRIGGIAEGEFVRDESRRAEIAVLQDDGMVKHMKRSATEGRNEALAESSKGSTARWEQAVELPVAGALQRGGGAAGLKLLRTKLSSHATDDLVVLEPGSNRIKIVSGGPETRSGVNDVATLETEGEAAAVLPMRLTASALSSLVVLTDGQTSPSLITQEAAMIFTVTNTNLVGPGSLEKAIRDANENPGADSIFFNIPGPGPHQISTFNVKITESVNLFGTSQPGFTGKPIIELNGIKKVGLMITGGATLVRGFVIIAFKGTGIVCTGAGENVIEGNYIGTDFSQPYFQSVGVEISGDNNLIGGTVVEARNFISGNEKQGISINQGSGNKIKGNFIGTNVPGTFLPVDLNRTGVDVKGDNNLIGGTESGARNIISGNGLWGIEIQDGSGHRVQGNFIGTDVTGTSWLGNLKGGVKVSGNNNLIGGTQIEARNIISGNGGSSSRETGIIIDSDGHRVQGNFIGTTATGTASLMNRFGVVVNGDNNLIGGTESGARNIISGNSTGVYIRRDDNRVQGNFIGTDLNGTSGLKNGVGVDVIGDNNLIGGTESEARNIISGNNTGVKFDVASAGSKLEGNFIGTDVTGSANLGNLREGVSAIGSVTKPNFIQENTIAFNGSSGIFVEAGFFISIRRNSIFRNAELGIDLGTDLRREPGVTPNDDMDPDQGANGLQNFPEPISATANGSDLTIKWRFNSTPGKTFVLEFFANPECDQPSNHGEGKHFIGEKQVTTQTNGDAIETEASFFFFEALEPGTVITSTATDSEGNTSEFSPCIAVTPPDGTNNPPVVEPIPNQTSAEGESFQYQVQATDPDNDPLSYSMNGGPEGCSIGESTGLIDCPEISHDASAQSPFNVEVNVSDGKATFTVPYIHVVINTNRPPVIEGPGNQMSSEGETVSLQIEAGDPDIEALTYSATSLPPDLAIDPMTGLISGTIDFDAAGEYMVTVTVSDGMASASASFTWTVLNTNRAPTITNPGNRTNNEGDAVSLQIEASDPDGDALTFSATGLPPGLGINPQTGLISGTIDSGSAGTYMVTVTASDGTLSNSAEFNWTVNSSTNQPPVITNPGNQNTELGGKMRLKLSYFDPDGDPLAVRVLNLPGGYRFNEQTQEITGRSWTGTQGSHTVTIEADDGTSTSTEIFDWTITLPVGVIEVTNTNSTGTGSFSNAINLSNSLTGANTVIFNIPGTGPHTIPIFTALPVVTGPNTTINGATQPGTMEGMPSIILNGVAGPSGTRGIQLSGVSGSGSNSVIGLSIVRFHAEGVVLFNQGNLLDESFIGVFPDGTPGGNGGVAGVFMFGANGAKIQNSVIKNNNLQGIRVNTTTTTITNQIRGNTVLNNTTEGIFVLNSTNLQIGGPDPEDGNVIGVSLNGGSIVNSTNITVQNNFVGTDRTTTQNLGNTGAGFGTSGGSNIDFFRNVFANNRWGLITQNGTSGVGLLANSFFNNFDQGFDRNFDGVTMLNLATLTLVNTASVEGTFSGAPDATFTIEFFNSDVAHPSGFGEGRRPLGTTTFMTDGSGIGMFSFTFPEPVASGTFITSMITDPNGDTWEFSSPILVP